MKTILSLLVCCFFSVAGGYAQSETLYTQEDKAVFDRFVAYISPYRLQPSEKVLEKTAQFFLETPYVAHTLDITPEETFIVNLREMDCVTFVENVVALSETAMSEELSFDRFLSALRKLRYRNGNIGDYASRLHYTSDWVYENQKRGAVENVSKALGGVKERKVVNFMSTHRNAYAQLKNNDAMWKKIIDMEDSVNNRGGFYYLPKQKITTKFNEIPHMAIIAFVTSIKGLDTTHVGFAYKQNGKQTFVHASSAQHKVVIDEKTLSAYCASQKSCVGVMVVRVCR